MLKSWTTSSYSTLGSLWRSEEVKERPYHWQLKLKYSTTTCIIYITKQLLKPEASFFFGHLCLGQDNHSIFFAGFWLVSDYNRIRIEGLSQGATAQYYFLCSLEISRTNIFIQKLLNFLIAQKIYSWCKFVGNKLKTLQI